MSNWADFQGRRLALQNEIARAIAARDGLDWEHRGSRCRAESEASDMISAWSRTPNREPMNELEGLTADAVRVDRELEAYKLELKSERAAAFAKVKSERVPESNPDTVELIFSVRDPDRPVNRPVCVRLPRSSVDFL